MLEVYYKNIKVNDSQYLKPTETSLKPTIHYDSNPNKLYTLIIHDPDAPIGNVIHWVVINIKGSNIESGKEIIKYRGPAPPSGSGIHRYIFLVYKQLREIKNTNITNNVIPMDKLLDQLGLKNSKPLYTVLFKSSYIKGGKKIIKTRQINKSKKITNKRTIKTKRKLK